MTNSPFNHEALSLKGDRPLVYTAMSKHLFYFRMHISKYVLEQGMVPLNPFMMTDYFLVDTVDRNLVRAANNSVVLRSDQIWVFGPISNGVLAEIIIAREAGKPISYYKIEKSQYILPITEAEIEMEAEVEKCRAIL